ncbi:MAG: hypothetical protein AAFP69_18550 [Planctomycetota bacterium]
MPLLLACALVSLATLPSPTANAQSTNNATATPLAMGGFCPVCIVEMKKWEKGNPAISSTFDGRKYLFPSAGVKAKFDANPGRYVPAIGGDCIVCYAKAGKRMKGSPNHAAMHKGRVYLFPSQKERAMFLQSPASYADSDVAVGGECIVCLVKGGKHIAGSTDHTVVHKGLRYLFPSPNEAAAFSADPQKFVNAAASSSANTHRGSGSTALTSSVAITNQPIRAVGRSGCAACEHGVHPLGSPSELGLAVNTPDGKILVVENAHQMYPDTYKGRFGNLQLEVVGMVIKTRGNVAWVQPTSLKVVN